MITLIEHNVSVTILYNDLIAICKTSNLQLNLLTSNRLVTLCRFNNRYSTIRCLCWERDCVQLAELIVNSDVECRHNEV